MSPRPPIDILPIQIRPDLTVRIAGIPHDLTREEAEKIARVVLAMALRRKPYQDLLDTVQLPLPTAFT